MAKIKYSALVSDMRNKLNGSVLSKNRYGSYVRNKVTPVNPQTDAQQLQRSRLSSASSAWKGLSQTVRNGFAEIAKAHPLTNIFGDQVTLDGKSMFTRLSINRMLIGQTALAAVPALKGVPFVEISSFTMDNGQGEYEFNINPIAIPAGYNLVVQATAPLPATINFVKNQYRTLGVFTAVTGTVDLQAEYPAKYPELSQQSSTGKVVHIRIFLVDTTSGEAGIAASASAVITA